MFAFCLVFCVYGFDHQRSKQKNSQAKADYREYLLIHKWKRKKIQEKTYTLLFLGWSWSINKTNCTHCFFLLDTNLTCRQICHLLNRFLPRQDKQENTRKKIYNNRHFWPWQSPRQHLNRKKYEDKTCNQGTINLSRHTQYIQKGGSRHCIKE